MPQKPNRLSQFWQELKRRRVIHVITVYATSTFVLIELVGNLAEPLNLPEYLPTLVIIVLAIGFPLVIILSWIYDLTSEGIEKTKPLSEIQEGKEPSVPNAWRIATYVSFAVIIGLVTLNILGGVKGLLAGNIQSLVILPFENLTGDDHLDWFAEGMHASLIQDMGRVSGFDVLGRTSSEYYKNVDMTYQEIASDSDRDVVIKPDVMCLDDDSLCFRVEVIRVFPKEKTIWIGEYKEATSQIPNLYNRLTKQIANEAKIKLTAKEDQILAESLTIDTAAYAAYIKGLLYLEAFDMNSLQKASEYFNIATKIEPDWAHPYAGLAMVGAYRMQSSFIPPSVARQKIYENLNRALELNPNSAESHFAKAVIAVWTEWNWKKGEQEFLKSLELNPSNAMCRAFYGHLLMILRRRDEAISQANLAFSLDQYEPFVRSLTGGGNSSGTPQDRILFHKKTLSINPDHRLTKINLSVVYRGIGDYEKWFELWKDYNRHNEEVNAEIDKVFQEQGYLAACEMIIKVEEEFSSEIQIHIPGHATRYQELNQYEEALDWLEKGYEIHHPGMPYIGGRWNKLKDYPRYVELVRKMNLPIPGD